MDILRIASLDENDNSPMEFISTNLLKYYQGLAQEVQNLKQLVERLQAQLNREKQYVKK